MILNNPINKPLLARFLASVDPMTMPQSTTRLEDLDSWEVDEIRDQAFRLLYKKVPTVIVPGPIVNNVYTIQVFEFHPDTWKLSKSPFRFTLKAVSNMLERMGWDGGQWVSQEDIDEAMKYIPN